MNKTGIIIGFLAAVVIAVGAVFCVKQFNTINAKDGEIAQLESDLSESKLVEEELKALTIKQNQELSNVLEELVAIAGSTSALKVDVENGSAEISRTRQIERSLDAVRDRILALERSNSANARKNREYQKVIDNFKRIVEEQKTEIENLKVVIAAKDKTIASQKQTIDTQSATIASREAELEALLASSAKALYDAGCDLEELGDSAPEVTWKKNKEKVKAMSASIYEQALSYYKKALEAGYAPASERIVIVQSKLVED